MRCLSIYTSFVSSITCVTSVCLYTTSCLMLTPLYHNTSESEHSAYTEYMATSQRCHLPSSGDSCRCIFIYTAIRAAFTPV